MFFYLFFILRQKQAYTDLSLFVYNYFYFIFA